VRVIATVLMLYGVVIVASTTLLFATVSLPWALGGFGLSALLLASFVGLRRMKRWSVFVFAAVYVIVIAALLVTGIGAFAQSPMRLIFGLLPVVLFAIAWLPNRERFD
jgi:hypothetical protein